MFQAYTIWQIFVQFGLIVWPEKFYQQFFNCMVHLENPVIKTISMSCPIFSKNSFSLVASGPCLSRARTLSWMRRFVNRRIWPSQEPRSHFWAISLFSYETLFHSNQNIKLSLKENNIPLISQCLYIFLLFNDCKFIFVNLIEANRCHSKANLSMFSLIKSQLSLSNLSLLEKLSCVL